jgi:hypothetical protein
MPATPPATPKAGDDDTTAATANASLTTAQADELALRFAQEKANAAAAAAAQRRDAALACALQAEEEATAATKDRDAAAQRGLCCVSWRQSRLLVL